MTNKELLQIFDSTKSVKKLLKLRSESVNYPDIPEYEIDWIERKKTKNTIFKKYLCILGTLCLSYLIFVFAPLYVTYAPLGSSILVAIPPILLVTLSWMVAAWWAYDKERWLFFAVTMGAIPVRLGIGMLWTIMLVPYINLNAYMFSLMASWILFTIPEIGMLMEMSKTLLPTSQLERK